jgi:hypothetical protein
MTTSGITTSQRAIGFTNADKARGNLGALLGIMADITAFLDVF